MRPPAGRVVYLTLLLAESHARLIASPLERMTFFKPDVVGASLHYISGFKSLEQDKLDGLLGLLRKILREHQGDVAGDRRPRHRRLSGRLAR